jgi:hypothetical protein
MNNCACRGPHTCGLEFFIAAGIVYAWRKFGGGN